MVIFRLTLMVMGDQFSPKLVVNQLVENCVIIDRNEPTDIPSERNSPYGFGAIELMNPQEFGLNHNGTLYEEWYIDFLEKYYALFLANGADEIRLETDIYFTNQCFIEVLDHHLLRRIGKLMPIKFSMPMNIYKLGSNKEIIDMLLSVGYTVDKIKSCYPEIDN